MGTPPVKTGKSALLPQWKWLSNPWVGAIGTLAGILGIVLGIYFYLAGQATRDLRITTDPPVEIVRAGVASSLDILYRKERITKNVYARKVYLWNAGNDSIRKENVLDPVGIDIPNATIMEVRVKKMSRPLTNFVVSSESGKLIFSWNILEHNDGAALDVVYAAPEASKLNPFGAVEHQHRIEAKQSDAPQEGSGKLNWSLAIAVGLVCFTLVDSIVKTMTRRDSAIVRAASFLLPILGFLFTLAWSYFVNTNETPPVF